MREQKKKRLKKQMKLEVSEMSDIKAEAIKLNARLQNMSDKEREKFIKNTMKTLNETIDKVTNNPEMLAQFGKDIQKNGHIIFGCILYSFEQRYREMYAELLTKIWQVM